MQRVPCRVHFRVKLSSFRVGNEVLSAVFFLSYLGQRGVDGFTIIQQQLLNGTNSDRADWRINRQNDFSTTISTLKTRFLHHISPPTHTHVFNINRFTRMNAWFETAHYRSKITFFDSFCPFLIHFFVKLLLNYHNTRKNNFKNQKLQKNFNSKRIFKTNLRPFFHHENKCH